MRAAAAKQTFRLAICLTLALGACTDASSDDSDDHNSEDEAAQAKDAASGASSKDASANDVRDSAARDPVKDAAAPSSKDAASSANDAAKPSDAKDAAAGDASKPASGDAGAAIPDLEALRQQCVDRVNMYRATLNLPALARATDQEACSDEGAKLDGDTKKAHGSAGKCKGLGGQNTCPGWGVGPRTGNATLADALNKCLEMMWNEGEPPVSRQECQADYQNCFLKHGHYLNMTDTRYKRVACGFYQMSDGKYWMNQNFGS